MWDEPTRQGSDDFFRRAFEEVPVGVSLTWLDGTMVVNRSFAQILGYTEAELRGTRWQDVTYPEDLAASEKAVASLLAGAVASARFQRRYVHKSGSIVWAEVSATLCRDAEGQPSFFASFVLDVTAHRQAGMEILFRNVLLTTLLETLVDGVLVVDSKGHVLMHNGRFLEICQVSSEVVASASDERLLEYGARQAAAPQGFRERISWLHEHPCATSHDELGLADGRTLDRHSAPLIAPDGKTLGRVWFFRDITERKRAEATLRAQLEELQRWQDVMLDREDRVAVLKREVNELCCRLGQPARYPTQLASADDAREPDRKTTTDLLRHAGRDPGEDGDQGP